MIKSVEQATDKQTHKYTHTHKYTKKHTYRVKTEETFFASNSFYFLFLSNKAVSNKYYSLSTILQKYMSNYEHTGDFQ